MNGYKLFIAIVNSGLFLAECRKLFASRFGGPFNQLPRGPL